MLRMRIQEEEKRKKMWNTHGELVEICFYSLL